MQSLGLGRVSDRTRIEFCIDAFVEETRYVPPAARPVINPTELSPALERVTRSLSTTVWRAWGEGTRAWFVHGRNAESPASPDSSDCPVLLLMFLDQDAQLVASGVWRRSAPSRWVLGWRGPADISTPQ